MEWASTEAMRAWLKDHGYDVTPGAWAKAVTSGELSGDEAAELMTGRAEAMRVRACEGTEEERTRWRRFALGMGVPASAMKNPDEGAEGDGMKTKTKTKGVPIRVKNPSERFSTKRHEVKHAKTGQPVHHNHKRVEGASELDHAKCGAYWLLCMKRLGVLKGPLSEQTLALLYESAEKDAWHDSRKDDDRQAEPGEVKALLDDTVSGGIYLNPLFFDDQVVTFPLLTGEIYPFLDNEDIPRGRRVETATIATPTVTWGVMAGTAVQPFNTNAMVNPVDTTVWDVTGAIELSNQLVDDSPVTVGAKVTELFGMRLAAELDRVAATGSGNGEPLGLTNSTITTVIPSDNSAQGAPTIGDAEALIFGVAKQYRAQAWNNAFVGSDVLYRRFRSIPVGPGDERRVLGMDEQSYQFLEYPYRVQNNIGNNIGLFGALKKYRMYRRGGFIVDMTREGVYAKSKNITYIVVRGRFGGQLLDASAFSCILDFAS